MWVWRGHMLQWIEFSQAKHHNVRSSFTKERNFLAASEIINFSRPSQQQHN
jgi:hypothetical protein